MITVAIQSIPTLLHMARKNQDPCQIFRSKRILALLPEEQWADTLTALSVILGDTLDRNALACEVVTARQQLGLT